MRANIAEAMTITLRQPSFLRVMLGLAATVVMLAKMRFDAPILDPILFAVVWIYLVRCSPKAGLMLAVAVMLVDSPLALLVGLAPG
jgi:hypothetical protein